MNDLNKMEEEVVIDKEDVEEKFRQRLKDQDSEHNGDSFWIGTMGKISFGNMGGNVSGVRVGGTMIPFSSLLNDLFQAVHK